MKNKLAFTLGMLLSPTLSFAFFCPNNFNQIEIGDTIAQVTSQCGKPDGQKESTKESDDVPQQWSYYQPQNVITDPGIGAQGNVETVITFDAEGKVINMSVNNVSVGSSPYCNGIKLGDTRDAIKNACGKPAFVSKQSPTNENENSTDTLEIKVTEFIYNANPPARLIFENGKLKQKM